MRRLIVSLVLVASSVPLEALAAPGEAVDVVLKGLRGGSIVEGTLTFQAEASSAAGIERLELFVGEHLVDAIEPGEVRQSVDLSYSWITGMVPDSAELAPNGEYAVTARATANGGADAETTARVTVDNPAATPVGVRVEELRKGLSLTWEPNPEPDLLGYQIERSSGSGYEILTQTVENSIIDPVTDGTYSYRVVAVRSSMARSGGRPSIPSSPVSISLSAPGSGEERGSMPQGTDLSLRNQAFASGGLPAPVGLPGPAALPGSGSKGEGAGTYEQRLPYDIPEGGIPLSAEERSGAGWDLIPADGLRWIAAGLLLLAMAALLRLVATRLEAFQGPPPLKL